MFVRIMKLTFETVSTKSPFVDLSPRIVLFSPLIFHVPREISQGIIPNVVEVPIINLKHIMVYIKFWVINKVYNSLLMLKIVECNVSSKTIVYLQV
jgi:hypothetical protein